MPFPLIPVLAATAAGAGLFMGYEKFVKPRLEKAKEGPLPGTVSELTKGDTYAVQVALAGLKTPGITAGQISTMLHDYFESVGFDLGTSMPTLRSKEDADKFEAKLTSQWIFTATWTKSEKFVGGDPQPMIVTALFTPLPVKKK